jgi:hypothetical protein
MTGHDKPESSVTIGRNDRSRSTRIPTRTWQDITIDQFIQIGDSYIRWHSEKRIKMSLGSLSPIEYRESLGITA